MEKQNQLGKYLREVATERNLTLRDFADVVGVSHAYIAKLIHGIDKRSNKSISPTIRTLLQIADSLDMPRIEFFHRCGYLDKGKSDRVI